MSTVLVCRFCQATLEHSFADLGMSPLCQTVLTSQQRHEMEKFYPLHAYVCHKCFLVQLGEYVSPQEIFSEYAYFSSYVGALLASARDYSRMMVDRFELNSESLVVELACNDGYLLQYFLQKGVPVLGVEPARNVAAEATKKGIAVIVEFFGRDLARRLVAKGVAADVVLGNNVLAQVPDLNDFVAGMKLLLKPHGVITMEFPHLMRLVDGNLFDTIYHEHFSYFSFTTIEQIFAAHGLTLFDLEEIEIHGGSIRIFGCHSGETARGVSERVARFKTREKEWGVDKLERYASFARTVEAGKREILRFLIDAKEQGKTIVGYGAPGKSTTLLNYCGIRTDFLDYTVDKNPYKQGRFTAGTHIPIFAPDRIRVTKPDFVFILPWNLKEEIAGELEYVRQWGGMLVVPLPRLAVF